MTDILKNSLLEFLEITSQLTESPSGSEAALKLELREKILKAIQNELDQGRQLNDEHQKIISNIMMFNNSIIAQLKTSYHELKEWQIAHDKKKITMSTSAPEHMPTPVRPQTPNYRINAFIASMERKNPPSRGY